MEQKVKRTVVIGAGGHSHSVCDILLQDKSIEIVGLVDGSAKSGFYGIELIGDDSCLRDVFDRGRAEYAFVAIGSNKLRHKLMDYVSEIGYKMLNAISPFAVVSPNVGLGEGIVVMAGAVVNAGAKIGTGSIINTNCSVDHDTIVSDYVHIAPGCAVCGNVKIGVETFLGVGTSVIDGITIGSETMIGAGASVVSDIPDNCTAVGVPARVIKHDWQNAIP